jgi:hypothetical protein
MAGFSFKGNRIYPVIMERFRVCGKNWVEEESCGRYVNDVNGSLFVSGRRRL